MACVANPCEFPVTSCVIDWTHCQPSYDNILYNMQMLDRCGRQNIPMTLVIDSYYNYQNNKISPHDVEMEFRKMNLNVGLIAVEWKKYLQYQDFVMNNGGDVIMRKDFMVGQYTPAKYLAVVVCKDRGQVVDETLKYNGSMEENLERLKESGEIIGHLLNKYEDSYLKIQQGKMLVQIRIHSFREIFYNILDSNPDARVVQIHDSIGVIIKNGIIISPVGVKINENEISFVLVVAKK